MNSIQSEVKEVFVIELKLKGTGFESKGPVMMKDDEEILHSYFNAQ